MKKMLIEVGTLPAEESDGGRVQPQQISARLNQPWVAADETLAMERASNGMLCGDGRSSDPVQEPALIDFEQFEATTSPSDSFQLLDPPGFSIEWMASLSEDWQTNNENGLFLGF
jgi:hypothetical protein